MTFQATRKLNQVGPTSLAVIIPKPFIDSNKLHATDPVLVLYGSLVLIVPPGAEDKFRAREELIEKVLE